MNDASSPSSHRARAESGTSVLPRDLIARCGTNNPTKAAYVCGNRSISWGELDARADRLGAALQRLGHAPGEPVGILAPECIEVYEHFYACMKIGGVRVGLNKRFAPREMAHVINDSRLTYVLVHASCAPLLDALRGLVDLGKLCVIAFGGEHAFHDYETLLAGAPARPEYPPLALEDPAMYSYTSGTTGLPKGAVLTHNGVKATVLYALSALGCSQDDIFYLPTGNAWVAVLLAVLGVGNGMTHLIPEGDFNTVQFLKDIERHRPTILLVAPTMLQWTIDEYRRGRYDLSSVRMIAFGSAPPTPALIRSAHETFGCDLLHCYALTETTWGGVSFLTPKDLRRGLTDRPELLGSVGRVATHFDLTIRDDSGRVLPTGEVGEVWLRGETVMSGYLNMPKETAEALVDGWLRTNDIGRLDEDGFLYLLDRRKFMIISGGVNVYPTAVESVLAEHAAVAEVCVVGVPHPVWGEAVVAVVRRHESFATTAAQELIEHCQERISKPETPKHIHFTDRPVPRTSNGKMQKAEVRGWFLKDPALLPWELPG